MSSRLYISFIVFFLSGGCKSKTDSSISKDASRMNRVTIPTINYAVIKTLPHDTTSFTEGFLVYNGILYESTGSPNDMLQTKSIIGQVDLNTGKINSKVELDRKKFFGEGITFLKGKLYQLTYQTKLGFIYDAVTFKKLGEFSFPNKEGWGMTTDGAYLIMSDGTNKLTYLEPTDFKIIKRLDVSDENGAVSKLNELEFIHGFIYANVYTTNFIVKVDPGSGQVVGRLDLASLVNEAKTKHPASLELNGIAYDSTTRQVYITGKMWPNIYQIAFNH